jgi:hypothetical protein
MSTPDNPREAGGALRLPPVRPGAALLLRAVLAVALTMLAHGTAAAQDRPVERTVEIRLNGERLGRGLVLAGRGGAEAWMRVADLRDGVDGSAGNRLRTSGRELHAAAPGGCATCRIRVVRQVVISRRVRVRAGEAYVPLQDVARAFEAKVSQDAGASVIHLHVGECRWCILEPRPVEPGAGAGVEVCS